MTLVTALLVFAALSLVLMFTYVTHRTTSVFFGGKRADSWTRGSDTPVPAFFQRAQHAHLNVVENLPVLAAIALAAQMLGRTAALDPLAPWLVLARLAQTATHLVGVSHLLVQVRAVFFTIQVVIFFLMIARLLG
jgi:uncharacterized MAPEG superfamily protein